MMNEKFTIGIIVSNHFGVLNRVAGLYAKRGYNIDSLAVGETENPQYSRMTIVSTGDDYMKQQVVSQLRKLHDVKLVTLFDNQSMIAVEHMLIKLKTESQNKAGISDLINSYGGRVMDFSDNYITAEVTGNCEKIDAFISASHQFGILELCRSGLISLSHGSENVFSVKDL